MARIVCLRVKGLDETGCVRIRRTPPPTTKVPVIGYKLCAVRDEDFRVLADALVKWRRGTPSSRCAAPCHRCRQPDLVAEWAENTSSAHPDI